MNIRPITLAYLPAIVSLHMDTLPGLSTKLGRGYVEGMYRTMLIHPQLHRVTGAFDKQSLIGVVVVSTKPHQTLALLRSLVTPRIAVQSIGRVLDSHIPFLEVYHRRQFEQRIISHVQFDDAYIVALTVAQTHRRQGIGTKLMTQLTESVTAPAIWVDTKETNMPARTFYEHHGFYTVLNEHQAVLLCRPAKK